MKKLLSLLTVMAVVLPMMAAGTASDAYLNPIKYATIDQAGATVDGMETIYKYNEVNGNYWLTLSCYGVMQTDATQNWFTNEITDADNTSNYTGPWTATDIFQGPAAYFGSNTAYSAKYKQPTKKQTYYVTYCTQVKLYAYHRSNSSYYLTKMNIYECTRNADGSITPDANPVETVQNSEIGVEILASSTLDPEKIYMVEVANAYAYLYEIAFKTPGEVGEITTPEAYDVTDITTHPVYPDNPESDAILCEGFACHWSPCPGAKSYSIRVYPTDTQEGLVYREKFPNCSEGDVYEDYAHIDGKTDHDCWYGRNISGTDGGVVIDVNGMLQSPMEDDVVIYRYVKKFTLKVKAKPYGDATDCLLRVNGGTMDSTIVVSGPEKWYTFVMDREFPNYYSIFHTIYLFQNMGNYEDGGDHRIAITDMKVYYGDYSEPQNVASPRYIQPAWSGDTVFVHNIPSDSTSFHFGYYTNAAGNQQIDMSIQIMDYGYYVYDVRSVYYDGQESDWSNQIPICIKPWPENLFIEDEDVEPMEFYVVGTFNDWNQAEDGGRLVFTSTATEGVYETQGTLEAGAEFKVITPAEDGWTWYGGQDDNGVGYFLINGDLLNQPLAMVDGANFRIEQGGEYTFRINSNDMTLTVLTVGEPVVGDVNGDGVVSSVDVTVLYNFLLTGDTEYLVNGDQDGDGVITTTDVTVVYNVLLGAQ